MMKQEELTKKAQQDHLQQEVSLL
jgi:hypothetical protein